MSILQRECGTWEVVSILKSTCVGLQVLGFVWDAVLVLLFACQGAIYMALAMVESTKCCGDEFTIPKNATG